jgi:hypothetical protein
VAIGPPVVTDAESAELIQPRKRPLDDPPPPAQARPMRRAAHGQRGHNVPRPETALNRCRVVAAITEHTARPPPRSPASA